MKKIPFLAISLLMVVATVVSSCQTKKITTSTTGTTPITTTVSTAAPGTVMVKTARGELVEKPQYGGTINLFDTSNPQGWDSWVTLNGSGGVEELGMIYDMLTGGDWGVPRSTFDFRTQYVPYKYTVGYSMASFENPDPLTFIIHLRKGMHYQNLPPVNGREVTAADLKWNVDRDLGIGQFAQQGKSPKQSWDNWQNVKSIDVDPNDKYTAIVHLAIPQPIFGEYWGTEWMPWLQPHEVVDQYGNDFTWDHAVGSGPWEISDFTSNVSETFIKNPTFYGHDERFPSNQIPYADKVEVLIIPSSTVQLAALRSGKIDMDGGLSYQDALSMKTTNPEIKWCSEPSVALIARLQVAKKPYSDIRVRKAMQMAVNLKEINDTYYGGQGSATPTMLSTSLGKDLAVPLSDMPAETQAAFTYNPDGAKKLLADAGYPSGFQQTFTVMTGQGQELDDLTQLLVSAWNNIGIKTTIQPMEYAALASYVYVSRKQDIYWSYYNGFWMPTQVLEYFYTSPDGSIPQDNSAPPNDPTFNKFRDDILASNDPVVRASLTKQADIYGTGQFWGVSCPVRPGFMFWQPWLKAYNGESRLTCCASTGTICARIWVDQAMKTKMIGSQ